MFYIQSLVLIFSSYVHINTYYLLQSVTTFQSFAKNKIPDLLVLLFSGRVPHFTKQIFLFWITLFGMLFINALKESINFKRTESLSVGEMTLLEGDFTDS